MGIPSGVIKSTEHPGSPGSDLLDPARSLGNRVQKDQRNVALLAGSAQNSNAILGGSGSLASICIHVMVPESLPGPPRYPARWPLLQPKPKGSK